MMDFAKEEIRMLSVETGLRQARIAIALERSCRAKGRWPEELEALVPGFLPEVLVDPMDAGEMRTRWIRREDSGSGRP